MPKGLEDYLLDLYPLLQRKVLKDIKHIKIKGQDSRSLFKMKESDGQPMKYYGEKLSVFYNTLFDENASCHFAIGNAVALSVENGGQMSQDELAAVGANLSLTHVDFMVGSEEMSIVGITADGQEIQIFTKGN